MIFSLLVFSILLGTVDVIVGAEVFDSSNYKALSDPMEEHYAYYAAKCTGELQFKVLWSLVNTDIQF